MTFVRESVEDLRFAIDDLRANLPDPASRRRALKNALNELYRLYEYRKGTARNFGGFAGQRPEGRTTEGVVFLRGITTHHLTKPVGPRNLPLYPGEHTFPGEDTFPGENFTWIAADDIAKVHNPDDRHKKKFKFYRKYVAGQIVLPTLEMAYKFLTADSPLGKLPD